MKVEYDPIYPKIWNLGCPFKVINSDLYVEINDYSRALLDKERPIGLEWKSCFEGYAFIPQGYKEGLIK